MDNLIKTLILAEVDLMDSLVGAIDKNKVEIAEYVMEIVKKDKEGEDCSDIFSNQRVLTARSSLIEQDLIKVISKINIYYNIAKTKDLDLGLSKELTMRLDFQRDQETSFYVIEDKKVVPRDINIINTLEERVRDMKTEVYSNFIEILRKSELYDQEDNKDTKSE